ncbi:MAG: hypothetical protein E6K95_03125, partial [Thaumarchaeota archaeon]
MSLKGESRTKRRAVSGVVGGLLLFSMLFSVGTGYFMFVINGESQYSQALANRTQGLQSQLTESLKITPASGASNHLVFTATNIGGTAANITDVFVLDPSGVTRTYGLGFGPNTTPALPGGVTPQKTSASYDTGITIVPGTYTIKVITHRGNAYTATYPVPPATSFASSTGSLTVDLSSFRWVQLTGTSSIKQENYVANCNAALCGVGFSSNVASGDTLVYAVGWANHIAPATPTDTRGNTFTLGAANTVTTPSTTPPTLVQQRYTSNCASSLCGLAYSSNVASGNTLAFALGWLNQSPPSTPTDTLGNTYTLGVSQSLADPAPTLVQKNYNSNCNSASCGLAYSSSVTAGNTLAFALGWYGQNPPSTPTDTRGDTFTLGVFNSVTAVSPNPPTLVQKNYNSNCNSASCGLAFSTNVASGNTLVFGLGWSVVAQYYVPITLTNNQGSATPTTFQQKITWNPSTYSAYESSTLGNIRFCADILCATTLNAWLESCTPSCSTSATSASAWVKLTSAIAASGGTQTVYMAFLGTSVDFDGNFWGEAPTIPGVYGQNDNGANVFTFYDNFAGTSLSVKWTVVKSSGGSVTVNNGATFTTGSAIDYAFVDSAPQTYPQVAESYMVSRTGFTALALGITTSNSVNGGIYPYNGYVVVLFKFSGVDYLALGSETSAGSSTVSFQAEPNFNAGIWQISWSSTSVQSATDGSVSLSGTSGSPAIANYGIYVGQSNNNPGSDVVDWGRMRAYPPSNVMPSTSFGSVGSGVPSVTDTRGDTFTLGVSTSVTAASTTYYSYIWYATAGSSGADTITASFSFSVTGSVSIYEINGATTTSPSTSTGSSSAGSTAVSVTSFTPAANSFVIGNAETSSSASTFTVGSGYTSVLTGAGGCDPTNAARGCSEYQTGVGSATTVPFTLGASASWVESAISFTPSAVYYSYIWYATAVSSGADTITASFSGTVTGSVSVYEISVNANPSIASSTGSSSAGSTTPSVASFTPVPTSIVIGNLETNTPSSTFTAGSGYVSVITGAGGCDPTNAAQGCSEYETGVSTSTTAPFTLGTSAPWVESAIAIGPNT